MSDYKKPSQWCAEKQEEALEAGDQQTALDYFQLYQHWSSKGM